MPRLRRIKDYEIDWSTDGHEQGDENTPGESSARGNEIVEQDASGRVSGWWSNETIIASLPDQKLRQAVEYHRTMLRLLESEMRRRALAPASQRRGQPDIVANGRRYSAVGPPVENTSSCIVAWPSTARRAARAVRRSTTFKGLKLSSEQMLKALEILCQKRKKD